jgi:hypothetical protein
VDLSASRRILGARNCLTWLSCGAFPPKPVSTPKPWFHRQRKKVDSSVAESGPTGCHISNFFPTLFFTQSQGLLIGPPPTKPQSGQDSIHSQLHPYLALLSLIGIADTNREKADYSWFIRVQSQAPALSDGGSPMPVSCARVPDFKDIER